MCSAYPQLAAFEADQAERMYRLFPEALTFVEGLFAKNGWSFTGTFDLQDMARTKADELAHAERRAEHKAAQAAKVQPIRSATFDSVELTDAQLHDFDQLHGRAA